MEDDRAVYVKNSTRLKTDKRWLPGYTHERDIAHLRPPQGSRPTSAVATKSDKSRLYPSDEPGNNAAGGDDGANGYATYGGAGRTTQADSERQDGDDGDGPRHVVGMDVEGEGEEGEGRDRHPTIAIPSAAMRSQPPFPSTQQQPQPSKRERERARNERERRHSQG